MKKFYSLLGLLCICFLTGFPVQASDTVAEPPDEFKHDFDEDSFFKDNFQIFSLRKAIGLWTDVPFIEVTYGTANPAIAKSFDGEFSPVNFISASAGYTEQGYTSRNRHSRESSTYVRYTNYSDDLGSERKANELGMYGWQLNFSDREAIGWNISNNFDIMLYHGSSIDWSSLKFNYSDNVTLRDQNKMSKIADGARFGQGFTGGIEFKLGQNFGIHCGYEQQQIFPRHKFWKWCGSELIEVVCNGLAEEFSDRVMDNSKIFGPVVYFIIQNAVSYGFYELRKSEMNWPFDTEAPLYLDKFSVGINFAF